MTADLQRQLRDSLRLIQGGVTEAELRHVHDLVLELQTALRVGTYAYGLAREVRGRLRLMIRSLEGKP